MARKSSKKKTTQNKRRKGFRAVLFPWLKRFGVTLAVLVGLLWVGAWIVLSESDDRLAAWAQQEMITASAEAGFVVQEVLVEGRTHTNPAILKALINIQEGDPLLAFNPSEAKDLIEKINWVDKAKVQRRFPGTIYIGLTEHVPIAIFQQKGKLSLINASGEKITDEEIEKFTGLLIVLGKNAAPNAANMIAELKAYPDIHSHLKSIKYIGQRRWDLITKNNLTVMLPEKNIEQALQTLSIEQAGKKILDSGLESIDLRIPERMIIKAPPGRAQNFQSGTSENKSNNI